MRTVSHTMTILMPRLDQLIPPLTKTNNNKKWANSVDSKDALPIGDWQWLHTQWNIVRGGSNNLSRNQEEEDDNHTEEMSHNKVECFEDEQHNTTWKMMILSVYYTGT